MTEKEVKLSALDVVSMLGDDTPLGAIQRAADAAKYLEHLGFARYLVAEHHNLGGAVSSATSVIIQYILQNTHTINVGSGGVMLPNHTPLQVAETYATLDTLYPGRVDLGLGRAPGTDPLTSKLITRRQYFSNQEFADDVEELLSYFLPLSKQGYVKALPGADAKVHPIILGSSLNSAYVAAALGLPYAFAAHINPNDAARAAEIYRKSFVPSRYLEKPYFILSVWLFTAKTFEKANEHHALAVQTFYKLSTGQNTGNEKLDKDFVNNLPSAQKLLLHQHLGAHLSGPVENAKEQWRVFKEECDPDELMAIARMESLEDIKEAYSVMKEAVQG